MKVVKPIINNHRLVDCIILAGSSFILTLLLTLLHAGLLPTVFADEWVYSSSARLSPLAQSISPSYLFLLLYRSTNYCGADFLACARLGNAFFFSLALSFIYLMLCKFTSRKKAIYVALLSLLSPINSYTAYFMPESMYFFGFWVFVWFVFRKLDEDASVLGSGVGLILGILSLVKIHAIFLIPAFVIFLLLRVIFQRDQIKLSKIVLTIGYMCLIFFMTRWLFGFIIAGQAGFNLLGVKYHYNVTSLLHSQRLLRTAQLFFIPLLGHIAALMLLFGMPIAALLSSRGTTQKLATDRQNQTLRLFTIACMIPLLFATIFTTAQIAGWGPYETINRIHMRYYNFIFPLFFMVATAQLTTFSIRKSYWPVLASAIIIAGVSVLATVGLPTLFTISYIDCPELFGVTYNSNAFYLITGLGLICLITWAINIKWGASFYVFLFMPFTFLIASYYVNWEIRQERLYTLDAYDRAGQFAHQYLGDETSHLAIVGSERGGLFKALFYIDNPRTAMGELPPQLPLEFAKIPKETRWILVIGDYPVLRQPLLQIAKEDFTLIKIK